MLQYFGTNSGDVLLMILISKIIMRRCNQKLLWNEIIIGQDIIAQNMDNNLYDHKYYLGIVQNLCHLNKFLLG